MQYTPVFYDQDQQFWLQITATQFCVVVSSYSQYQRIYINDIQGQHRPSSYKDVTHPTSPCCLQYSLLPDCLTEQAVSHIFVRRWPVLSFLSLTYILWSVLECAEWRIRIQINNLDPDSYHTVGMHINYNKKFKGSIKSH